MSLYRTIIEKFLVLGYRKYSKNGDRNLKKRLHRIREAIYPPDGYELRIAKISHGLLLNVNIAELVGGDIYFGVEFEPDEMSVMRSVLQPGMTFFDIGANYGYFSLVASRLVGSQGMVHAFEPAGFAYRAFFENIKLNNASNVVANRVAVSDKSGENDLYINRESGLTSLGKTERGQVRGVEKIQCITLDEYVSINKIQQVDFIKLDVEGFEGHVLRGASHVISNFPDLVILCELAEKNYHPLGFSVNAVINWIRSKGYLVWEIDKSGNGVVKLEKNRDRYLNHNFVFAHTDSKYIQNINAISNSRINA